MGFQIRGVTVPSMLYGTAWKELATEALVVDALDAGFRGIDTANQRKHYNEEGVGRAVAAKLREGIVRRDELFLQTKFTHRDGQDHRLPYDPAAPIRTQVEQSFQSSLEHFGVDVLDSLILHGPSQRDGLGAEDLEVWRAMEGIAQSGRVKLLGVSNVTANQVQELVGIAAVPVSFVQNRCYAERGWDRAVRAVCNEAQIVYQGFSLLTANRQVLASPKVIAIAVRHGVMPAQIVFRFAQQVGMLPLTGTKDPVHMREDLAVEQFSLDADELAALDASGGR
ncbi:MAG: aldo/keto reductase [Deltaproteobacteria bacterium]|nr:aldo/keto reductase [Deltaproteobacteria bacterium]